MHKQSLDGLIQPNSLFSTYIEDYNKVKKLYAFDPNCRNSYRHRQKWLQQGYQQHRDILVKTLTGYNRSLGCSTATEHNLNRLANPETLAVVTGQQAGVATGPLYTIYKAITTVQLARKLETELGVPVVPIFWVASEDHDYQEINHVNVLRGAGSGLEQPSRFTKEITNIEIQESRVAKQPSIKKLTLAGYPSGKQPIGTIAVAERTRQFVIDLAEYLPETSYKQGLITILTDTVQASANLAEWFGRLFTVLMGQYGLIIADPLLPGLRQLLIPFFQKAVQESEQIASVLSVCGQEIKALGCQPAFSAERGFTGLFTIMQEQRIPLVFLEGRFSSGVVRQSWDDQQILEVISQHPEFFSCSAVLRPVAQDILFPTVAYVGGPGEIAYFGQLKEVYQVFGQQMPVLFPRQSYTLIEPEVAKILRENKLTIENVRADFMDVLTKLLQDKEGLAVVELFSSARERITAEHQTLTEGLAELEPDLSKIMPGNLVRMLYQLDYLEKKANQQIRKKHRNYVNELYFAEKSIFPNGGLQERIYNIIPYLARYGSDWLNQLVEEELVLGYSHQAVYLERPIE